MLRKKGSGGFEYRQQREEPLARHLDYGEDEGSEMQVQVNEEELMTKHWLTRVCFLRFLGFLYLIAFLIALDQNEALLGEEGLTPSVNFMQRIMQRAPDPGLGCKGGGYRAPNSGGPGSAHCSLVREAVGRQCQTPC